MPKSLELIRQRIDESIGAKSALLSDAESLALIGEIAGSICSCLRNGGKVILAGNGGSFSDSMHLATEFVSRFMISRDAMAAVALGTNNSTLTAIGNDYDFSHVFAREVRALGRAGDLFIAISTSGNSENVLRSVDAAKEMGLKVFGLTGRNGGRLSQTCPCIRVPSDVTARIQEVHILVGHIICELVEKEMFPAE